MIEHGQIRPSPESESLFRELVRNASGVIAVSGTDGVLHYVNDTVFKFLGYAPKQLVGRRLSGLVHAEDVAPVGALVEEVRGKPGNLLRTDVRVRHAGGEWCWMEAAFQNLSHVPGVDGVVINLRDATGRKLAEQALRESEERFRRLIENLHVGVLVQGPEAEMLLSNPKALELLGLTEDQLLGRTSFDPRWNVIHEDGSPFPGHTHPVPRAIATGRPVRDVVMGVHRPALGDRVWLLVDAEPQLNADGGVRQVICTFSDITGLKRAEDALRRNEQSLAAAQEITHLGNWEYEVETGRSYWSDELYRIFGYAPRSFAPSYRRFLRAVHPDDRKAVREAGRKAYRRGELEHLEYRVVRPTGEIRHVRTQFERFGGDAGGSLRVFGTIHDVTERKRLEERLAYQAFHDALTGLPNRAFFLERLEFALSRAERQGDNVAVMFLDLDNFKVVNDSLGHEVGDRLLAAVGRRLQRLLRSADTVARLGGDEFTVLLDSGASEKETSRVAERILAKLREPFAFQEQQIFVTASIGIAISEPALNHPGDLLRRADLAMYRAKGGGKAGYQLFAPNLNARIQERLRMELDLRRAVERDEFEVFYQPMVRLADRRIVGVECLLRWRHPERGLLKPSGFVPVAEETGLMLQIGRRVLEEACWRGRGWRCPEEDREVCVNLSARQLEDPDLVGVLARLLRETGFAPGALCLEITESVLMEDVSSTADILRRLKDLGVRLAIDDFGTGYSSLSYLKKFPVDTVKIDRSFVAGLGKDPEDEVLVSAMSDLVHALGRRVVAEGVETEEQAGLLRSMGCDAAQGNHFWPPLDHRQASSLLPNR